MILFFDLQPRTDGFFLNRGLMVEDCNSFALAKICIVDTFFRVRNISSLTNKVK